jgi:hypothetical protein
VEIRRFLGFSMRLKQGNTLTKWLYNQENAPDYKPFRNPPIPINSICHTCESRYPVAYRVIWIPAFAGMTVMKWFLFIFASAVYAIACKGEAIDWLAIVHN